MNWKHEAVNKLRRYDAMQRATVNLPLEIKRLKAETEAVRSGLQVGFAGGKSSRSKEDALLDNLMKRQQLQWSLDQAQSWTGTVSRALEALEPEEQLILQQLYILPREGAVGQLMERLSVERSTVYRRRDRALKKFTLSLYGGEESN